MRTVLIAALTAVVVAVLVTLLMPPPSTPAGPTGPDPELLRRLDDLERALEARETAPPARLEGTAEPPALRIRALEARLEQVEEATKAQAAAPPASAPTEAEKDQEKDEEYQRWIDRLYDANENVAFSAALELARLGDPRAIKALAYVLGTHHDYYVRLGCASALGDLSAIDGVPALIEALSEKDQLVRTAAHDALQKITSANIEYDGSGTEEQRLEAQTAWREWFKENEARLRASQNR